MPTEEEVVEAVVAVGERGGLLGEVHHLLDDGREALADGPDVVVNVVSEAGQERLPGHGHPLLDALGHRWIPAVRQP